MQIASSLLFVLVAATLFYGTSRLRGHARLAWLDSRARVHVARGIAVLAMLAAHAVWSRIEDGTAAALVVLTALTAMTSILTVLAPLFPRLVSNSVLLGATTAPVLFVLGGAQ